MQLRLAEARATAAKYKSRATDVARVASQKRRAVKEEAARFRSQLEKVKSSWGPPKDMQKLKKQLGEAHATSKMLRLDLARKAKRLDALEKTAKQEKKDEADAVQKLERLQSRVRRAEAEARRRDSSAEEMKKKLRDGKERVKVLEAEALRLQKTIDDSRDAHQQRKSAVEALREGIAAQRTKVSELQEQIREQTTVQSSVQRWKAQAERKAKELRSANQQLSRANEEAQQYAKSIQILEEKARQAEAKATSVQDESRRKLRLANRDSELATEQMKRSVISFCSGIMERSTKLRTRVAALRGSGASPGRKGKGRTPAEAHVEPNQAFDDDTVASVASLLEMSHDQVNELLGIGDTFGMSTPNRSPNQQIGGMSRQERNTSLRWRSLISRIAREVSIKKFAHHG